MHRHRCRSFHRIVEHRRHHYLLAGLLHMKQTLVGTSHTAQIRKAFAEECESVILVILVVHILDVILRYRGVHIDRACQTTVPSPGDAGEMDRRAAARLKHLERSLRLADLLMLKHHRHFTGTLRRTWRHHIDMDRSVEQQILGQRKQSKQHYVGERTGDGRTHGSAHERLAVKFRHGIDPWRLLVLGRAKIGRKIYHLDPLGDRRVAHIAL